MNIYKIKPQAASENIVVDFGAELNSKLWDVFLGDDRSETENFLNINGSSQVDNFNNLIDCSDFLSCVVPFPIFSKRAVDVLRELDCLSFLNVGVDGVYKFSIGLVNAKAKFVDEEKSKYKIRTNGDRMLSVVAYREPLESFFIARDEKYYSNFVVSDDFVERCKKNNLKIRFEKIEYGHPKSFFNR
ncbi:hypothetical protein [Shewanella chilikensis]|uniref:hypothetical protein n=1 Tax=Shewanella chilikensis TaxID=558541 RepID=UPI001F3654B9|nr:hypothetical protein [Shewanella chilikensis]MCE9789944.1 hypothetical protein [Shewanella chilikensis]